MLACSGGSCAILHGVRRYLVIGSVLVSACGGSVETTETCPSDRLTYPKAWFVGDPVETGDEPELELTITISDTWLQPPLTTTLEGARASMVVTAQVTEDVLILRDQGGEVRSAFKIQSHRASACGPSPWDYQGEEPYPVYEDWRPPWFDRPWFRLDLSADLAPSYAFDAATANGYPDAVEYHPIEYYVEGVADDLADDRLAFDNRAYVTWNDIDEATPGCAFDIPDATSETGCPSFEIALQYELRRRD